MILLVLMMLNQMNDGLPFKIEQLQKYLSSIYETAVKVVGIRELTDPDEEIKGFGYGMPLLIEVDVQGIRDRLVMHTVRPGKYGHERRADRAQSILLDFDTFNKLPKHVPALGVGAFTQAGELASLDDAGEFFLVTKYFPGRLFAEDFKKLTAGYQLLPEDRERVLALADYLAGIHSRKHDSPNLYLRCIRDLLGHGEGIMGLIDSYPPDFAITSPNRLHKIEKKLIDWRWQLKGRANRLSQVHGDFHPWNILFDTTNEFVILDRSRGEFGEPADDISAMSINFIFFSLQQEGSLQGAYRVLYELFWEHYLQNTQDLELNNVIQPFYAWRALVLAHPTWYPNLEDETRLKLFEFIERILQVEWFDPGQINKYLGVVS